jgi:hypothetical protein
VRRSDLIIVQLYTLTRLNYENSSRLPINFKKSIYMVSTKRGHRELSCYWLYDVVKTYLQPSLRYENSGYICILYIYSTLNLCQSTANMISH